MLSRYCLETVHHPHLEDEAVPEVVHVLSKPAPFPQRWSSRRCHRPGPHGLQNRKLLQVQ
jgi:hypothetical protein